MEKFKYYTYANIIDKSKKLSCKVENYPTIVFFILFLIQKKVVTKLCIWYAHLQENGICP